MKKTRILAAALIASVMLVGAGYAAWTDKLTINSTVSTGELNVDFVQSCLTPVVGTSEESYAGNSKIITIPAPYASAKIDSWDKKQINITIKDLYPGSLSLLAAKIQNNGTIPAKFDKAEVIFNDKDCKKLDKLKEKLMCAGGIVKVDKNGNEIALSGKAFYNVPLKNLQSTLNEMLRDVRLEPGESITFDIPSNKKSEVAANVEAYDPDNQNCILFYLPITTDDNVNKNETVENAAANFNIEINWKQHNQ